MLEIHTDRVPESDIPEEAKIKCRPGKYVWRLTVVCDDEGVRRIEKIAHEQTATNPLVDNDIGRRGNCSTKTARVVHALEHILVLSYLKSGQIPTSELLKGNVAYTVPGTASDGSEIAAFWIRDGLVDDSLIDEALMNLKQLLYES